MHLSLNHLNSLHAKGKHIKHLHATKTEPRIWFSGLDLNDLLKRLIQLLSELCTICKTCKIDLKTWNCPAIKICFLEQFTKQIGGAEDTEWSFIALSLNIAPVMGFFVDRSCFYWPTFSFQKRIQILTRIERRSGRTARWRHLNILSKGKLHTCWEREGGMRIRKSLSLIKRYYFNRPHIWVEDQWPLCAL